MNNLEKLKEIIESEKATIAEELYKAAELNDKEKFNISSANIQKLKMIEDILLDNPNNNTKRPQKSKKEEQRPIKKNSELTVLPITENFTNKRPTLIEMDGQSMPVNSFRSLTETACRIAYNNHTEDFISLCKNPKVNGDRHQYFAHSKTGMNDPVMLGNGSKAVYVDISKLAINNLFFLKKALTEINYDLSKIMVTINPSYFRKPREKKAK